MGKPILGFWDFRGRAEAIRYLLHYKKVDFVDKRFTMDEAGLEEWKKEKFNLGFDFPNLPYYIDDDVKISISTSILRYLGQKHGLDGKTADEKLRVLIAEQQSVDFREKLRSFLKGDFVIKSLEDIAKNPRVLEDDDDVIEGRDEFLKKVQPLFQQFEKFLGDKKFLAADDVTYVDFMIFENLDYYRLFHKSILDDYPSLKAYFNRMKNLPELQEYKKSPVCKQWPIFGPYVKFGYKTPPKHL